MSIPSLMSALSQGFTAQQIVTWLTNNHKKLAKNIKSAKTQGYTDDDILNYLTKGKHASHGERNEMLPGQTEQEKGARIFNAGTDWKKVRNVAGTAASLASTAYGLSKIPTVANSIRGIFNSSQNTSPANTGALQPSSAPNVGPTPMSNAPLSNPPQVPQGANASSPLPTPSGTQSAPNITPPSPSQSSVNSHAILGQMQVIPKIKSLQQAGNNPEAIAAAVGVSFTPTQKKWLDDQIKEGKAKPLADMITDVISQPQPEQATQQPIQTEIAQNQPVSERVEEPKLEKGHIVSTPDGVMGEVKSVRNGKALIDENGKLHQAEEKDLISSPLPQKDLADLYQDLIEGIEKETGEEVSRNVNIAAYNPETNKLLYHPHAGGIYIYANIPEEDKDLLTKFLTTRKTTGSNFMGGWEEGTKSPIGAAMSALIKRLQSERGGKGSEYEEKYDIIYEALNPAVEALKKRKRDEKKRKR